MKELKKNYRLFRLMLSVMSLILILNSCEIADDLTGVNEAVAKLEGEWTCDENSEIYKSTTSVYSVSISPDPDNDNGVIIDNFYGVNAAVYASVSLLSLTVNEQTASGGYKISGSGIISSNYKEINWSYTVDDGSGVIDHVTAIYTKN
jgi:hypothetical protein